MDPRKPCKCSAPQIDRYLAKISGPLLERIDIHVEVPAVPISALRDIKVGTDSASMRAQVQLALEPQRARFGDAATMTDDRVTPYQLRKHCPIDADDAGPGREAMDQRSPSVPGWRSHAGRGTDSHTHCAADDGDDAQFCLSSVQ